MLISLSHAAHTACCGNVHTSSSSVCKTCRQSLANHGDDMHCRYKSWSEAVGKATASVAVLYSSDYGYSDRLSQTLARGITKAGVATEMVDVLNIDTQVGSLIYARLPFAAGITPSRQFSNTAGSRQHSLLVLLQSFSRDSIILTLLD